MSHEQRLYDRASDIAMLRVLMGDEAWHAHGSVIRAAIDLLGWGRVHGSIATGMHSTLRGMGERGILEPRIFRQTIEYRYVRSINVKLVTGGLDPLRMDVEEILELDLPSALSRRVEFEPKAYLKGRTREARVAAALQQCPSPWAYAQRLKKA